MIFENIHTSYDFIMKEFNKEMFAFSQLEKTVIDYELDIEIDSMKLMLNDLTEA